MTENKKHSFMKGIFTIMISQFLIKILGMLYSLYLTNKSGFGDEGNGLYGAGFQIYSLLLAISSVGVPNAISKLVSERVALGQYKGAHRIFKIAFAFFGIIGFIGSLILFLGANFISNVIISNPRVEYILMIIAPSVFFVSVSSVIRGYFAGYQEMRATANSQFIEQLFKAILSITIVYVLTGKDIVLMASGATLATTLATILSFLYLCVFYKARNIGIWDNIKNSVEKNRPKMINIIKAILIVAIPISLSSVMSVISKNIDSITVIRGLKSIGYSQEISDSMYGLIVGKIDTLVNLPLAFNIAFSVSLVPTVAAAKIKKDLDTISKRISFSMLLSLLISIPFVAVFSVLTNPILKFLFTNINEEGYLLQVSVMIIIFTMLGQTVVGALQGLGKVYIPAIALLFGIIGKLITNIVLIRIPEINILGSIIGSIVAQGIYFTIVFITLLRNTKIELSIKKFIIKPLIAGSMMMISVIYIYDYVITFTNNRIAVVISLFFCGIIYVLSIIMLKVFNKEEILMFPYGDKIYNILLKLGIYNKRRETILNKGVLILRDCKSKYPIGLQK